MYRPYIFENGNTLSVTFEADYSNDGNTGLLVRLIPEETGEANADFKVVAPGGRESISLPLTRIRAVRISIDVPDTNGSGRLIVKDGGERVDSRAIQRDTQWTYSVE